MPNFPVIDSHVHLYDVEKLSYPWLANLPRINRSHGLADFDAARGPVEVEALVFAEVWVGPGLHLEEAAWVQGLADRDRRLAGMVAHLPMERGPDAVRGDLEKLLQHPTLRGIRRLIEIELDPRFCLEPGFIAALKLLPRHDLVFDICVKHWCLPFAVELAKRCPEVGFVLDHLGKPGIKHGMWQPWADLMTELGRLPNVVCKVSGVITEADHANWTRDEILPYLRHAIDCFGFERLMYGSDWTVSELTHRYPEWVDIVDEAMRGTSEAEQRQLFRDTAKRVYRLDA